ncbi:MAG: protein-disulfide reductase DsbD domain-containing protein [Akkermansiaceae bacterium]
MSLQQKICENLRNLRTSLMAVLSLVSLVPLHALEAKGLDITLISDVRSVSPGSSFTIGLNIRHHKGFHTYWKNPGVVGMATAMEWKLPEGFTAGEIQWPHPEISSMAGHPCHGYERDVTLLVTITPPKKITQNNVKLTASCRWMCCAKDCFPGFQDLSLTLPVSKKARLNQANTPHFKKARAELPERMAPWKVSVVSARDEQFIQLLFSPLKPNAPAPEYLFSEDGQVSSDKKQNFIKQANGSFQFTIERSEFSPKGKMKLPCVVRSEGRYYSIGPKYRVTPPSR